eukprot:gene4322-4575_t
MAATLRSVRTINHRFGLYCRLVYRGPEAGATARVQSLNIISGWHTAAQLKSWPTASAVYQALCYVFAILSVIQQLHLRWGPESYYEHRTVIRGGWMLAMFCSCSASDISDYFVQRKLEQGVSNDAIVLQLLMLFTLILLGQCLYWPIPFRLALPLQTLYVCSSVAAMRSVKCVLQEPPVAAGATLLCTRVQQVMNVVAMLSAELSLPADGIYGPNAVCTMAGGDLVLTFWLLGFGMYLPLYVLYVNELIRKRVFLKAGIQQPAADPQQQPAVMTRALKLGWLVHVAAVVLLLTLSLAAAEAFISWSGPAVCPSLPANIWAPAPA